MNVNFVIAQMFDALKGLVYPKTNILLFILYKQCHPII